MSMEIVFVLAEKRSVSSVFIRALPLSIRYKSLRYFALGSVK
jgi:hypothetical protein